MGRNETVDHFTPRSVALELGWGTHHVEKQDSMIGRILNPSVNDPINKQRLSWRRHQKKDESTPHEAYWVKFHGGGKTVFQHHNEQLIYKYGMPKVL